MDEPPSWRLLQHTAQYLTRIRTDAGYRTDIGAHVALEPMQHPDQTALGLTLVALDIARDEQQPQGRHRQLHALIEATVPTTLDRAHAHAHAIAADIEAALDEAWLSNALPVRVEEIVFLDRPEGLPVVAVQVALTLRYCR
jgi:hypothetical protein